MASPVSLPRRPSQQHLPDAATLSSMQGLPRSGNSSAQTSASLHPPPCFACGASHSQGHGRPRSVLKSSRLRWKCLFMDCICSDIANLSAHLPRLPTPPPYLRRMRLSPGRGAGIRWVIRLPPGRGASIRWMIRLLPGCVRGCWVLDDAVASQGRKCWVANDAVGCPWHSSCKSPRARILVLGTSGAHWPARWPQFELTERVAKS